MKSNVITTVFGMVFLPAIAWASTGAGFTPLIGIPGLEDQTNFNSYINALYALSISIAALVAVIQIVIAGAQYMLSDLITSKSDAKERIRNSLIGLLIIIGAVVILNTVNSEITEGSINAAIRPLDDTPSEPVKKLEAECRDNCIVAVCNQNRLPGISEFLPAGTGKNCAEQCEAAGGFFYKTESSGLTRCAVTSTDLAKIVESEKCPPGETCTTIRCDDYKAPFGGIGYWSCASGCSSMSGIPSSDGKFCTVTNASSKIIPCTSVTPSDGVPFPCKDALLQCYNESGYVTNKTSTSLTCNIPKQTGDININTNTQIRDREINRIVSGLQFNPPSDYTSDQINRLLGLPTGIPVLGDVRISSEEILAASGGVTPDKAFLDAIAAELTKKCPGEEGVFHTSNDRNGSYDFYCLD